MDQTNKATIMTFETDKWNELHNLWFCTECFFSCYCEGPMVVISSLAPSSLSSSWGMLSIRASMSGIISEGSRDSSYRLTGWPLWSRRNFSKFHLNWGGWVKSGARSFDNLPDVILMIRIVIQLVRGLELLPDRRAAALQECIDWILILPVDLEGLTVTINQHIEHTSNITHLHLTSQTSQSWGQSRPQVSRVSKQRISRWR